MIDLMCLVTAGMFVIGLTCHVTAGAFVIGTTSTEAKALKARAAGADETVLYSEKDFVTEVNRITKQRGVDVIYDGVGKTTFHRGGWSSTD